MIVLVRATVAHYILSFITYFMSRYESCHMKQFKRGRTEAVRALMQREHSAAAN